MKLSPHSAHYSRETLLSLKRLAYVLRQDIAVLEGLAAQADSMYRAVPPQPDSTREVFDAKPPLKAVQKRIKVAIFGGVRFPPYITGSVPGRDYKANAALHAGQQLLICEDVKSFFPSVTSDAVRAIWREFFKFSAPVADLLTALTTRLGSLPQGAITSSYLANLVLWRREPILEAKLRAAGLTYSRYVDDIAISSNRHLLPEQQELLIAQVYGMLQSEGLKASRSKHEVNSASGRMIVTKLVVNKKPALPLATRNNVRAAVFQLERIVEAGDVGASLAHLHHVQQRIGQLARFHGPEATVLAERVDVAKAKTAALAAVSEPSGGP